MVILDNLEKRNVNIRVKQKKLKLYNYFLIIKKSWPILWIIRKKNLLQLISQKIILAKWIIELNVIEKANQINTYSFRKINKIYNNF